MTVIAIPRETQPHERRAAASADTVKKFRALGMEVRVEAGAGEGSAISDEAFAQAGAQLMPDMVECVNGAEIVLTVQPPSERMIAKLAPGAMLVGTLSPYGNRPLLDRLAKGNITAFAMELMPRISRAQSMDVLSSQANLAGYR